MADFALAEGWEYVVYSGVTTKVYPQTTVTILNGEFSGWLYNALVLSNNPSIEVNLEIDHVVVAKATPASLYYGNSNIPANGVPYAFIYGAYLPDQPTTPQYGMVAFNNSGWQFNKTIKIYLNQPTSPITLYNLEYEYVRITDRKLFMQTISEVGSLEALLKSKQITPAVSIGGKR
ncbi:MAG: hypothetical protein QXL94_00065 [Candidatus Parvarchaeum sp.]